MDRSRETNIIFDGQVIHTQYYGDVDCDYILDAIDEWESLLKNDEKLCYLVFDYTNANMDALTKDDVKK